MAFLHIEFCTKNDSQKMGNTCY